ncbi:hypothetical protein FOA52_000284 [Chlamydomonas sp. UWO 241]|nr:hypothetical protein FOA52_000284 [Chlamydomonas sp. UWO 241]
MPSLGAVYRYIFGVTTQIEPATKYTVAKWYYLSGFIITSTLTWVLRDYANDWFVENAGAFALCQDSAENSACGSQEVAIRVSFANFSFFALHFVLCFWLKREEDFRVDIHAGLWFWKTLLWMGTLVGFFYVPSHVLIGYAQFARVASGFYLVLQMILLIDLFYKVNEWLVEDDVPKWRWALLGLGTLVCFGLGLVLIGFSYFYYAPRASCSLNIFFITWSLVIMFLLVGVLFIPNRAPTAGLLTSGAVFLYGCFLLYSALNSEPNDYDCIRSVTSRGWIQVVAFFISLAAVMYSTLSAGISSNDMFGKRDDDAKDSDELPYRADWFHLVFSLASCYIAMLFSQWEVSPSTSVFQLDEGWISTWVKMASKWVCELLYIWTVVAPAILQGRDFGYRV